MTRSAWAVFRVTRRLTIAVIAVATLFSALAASGYITGTGAGSASAAVGYLGAPTTMSATATSPNVTVTWDASQLGNGTAYAQSYTIERYDNSSTPVDLGPACAGTTFNAGGGTPGPPEHFQCIDSPGAAGTYKYKITAAYHHWTATSAFTNTATTAFGTATKLVFTTQPVGGVAEATNFGTSPAVSVEDASGNVVTTDTGNVTLGINTGPGAGSLSCSNGGFPTVAAVAGVASFTNCQISGSPAAGTYTLLASRGGLTAGTSGNVVINPGGATKLVFSTQPVGGVAEATSFGTSPVVSVEDAFANVVTTDTGNVTLAIGSGPGTGSLSCSNGGFPTVAAVAGVASFTGCQISGTAAAGTYTLAATRGGLTGGASGNVVINVGAASKLVFTTQPVGGVGEATNFGTSPVVSVEDAFANVVTTDTGNVTLAIGSGPGAGSLACSNGGFPTVAAVAGVATFVGCQIAGTAAAGTYTLAATRGGLTGGASGNVVINVGAASKLVFTTQPVGGVAEATGFGTSPVVSVEDAFANVVSSDTGSVTLAIGSGPGAGSLSCSNGGFPTVAAVAGVASFTGCQISGTAAAGTYTLAATRGGLTGGASGNVVINVGSASKLVFTTQPVGGVAEATGFGTSPVVSVEDSSGNVVTSDTGNVTLAINSGPGSGSLSCSNGGFPTVAAVAGVATFTSCQISGTGAAGTYTLAATRAGLTSTGASSNVGVNVGAATKLVFTTQPVGGVVEATNFGTSPAASVEDAFANVLTTDTGNVTLAISSGPGAGSLSCSNGGFPTIAAVAGVASFTNCKISGTAGAGTYTLNATRAGLTSTGASSNVVINVGSASKLVFATQPVAGVAEATSFGTSPVVSVEDALGNVVSADTGNVTLAISSGPGAGSLSCSNGGFPTIAAVAGVATFTGCQISGTAAAGTYTLAATRAGLTSTGASGSVVINVGAASKMVFTTQPVGGVVEATNFGTSPAVSVEDASGNVVTTDTGNVTLAINTGPGSGSLSCSNGGFPTVAAVAGVATFTSCQISGTGAAGTYTLAATRAGLTSTGASSNVVVNVGSASKLGFVTQPGGGVVSTAWSQQPAVAIEDSSGNTVTSASATAVTLTGSSGQGTLSCTTNPVTTSSGLASFAGCKIATAGSGNVLTASGTFTSGTSITFTIFAVPSLSEVATGFASGSSVSSGSFTPVSGATYLVFAAHTSSASDSATLSSGAWSSSTAVTSQTLSDGISYQWAWLATANTTSSSTATVNFTKATTKATIPGDNVVEVVRVSNADATTPVLGTTLTAAGTASKQLVANLPSLPTGGSYAVFAYVAGDVGAADGGWNTAGFTSLASTWNHSGGPDTGFGTVVGISTTSGASATYGNGGFPATNGDAYGTIALGINPQPATPTVTAVSPAAGTTAGGTSVTVTGTNLTGATAVDFGATPGSSVSVNGGGTSLTVNSPAHAAGQVDITVVTGIGTSATSSADEYTYDATPTVTAVSPAAGTTAGSTIVSVTGTGFLSATAVKFGTNAGTSLSIASDTSLTISSPSGSAGTVDVTVTNPTGTSSTSPNDQFTYYAPPTVTAVSPAYGAIGGGTSVTVTGTNLTGETAVNFGATPGSSVSVNGGGTTLTVTTPAHTLGQVDVTVVTPGGTSATSSADQYTYETTPTVTAISPAAGPTAGATTVTVTGTGFLSATGVKFGANSGTSLSISSDTSLTITSPSGSAGTAHVTVTSPSGTSSTSAADLYTYDTTPTVTAVSPNTGTTTGATSVTVTGTGFLTATSVKFGTNLGTSLTISSDTSLTITSPAGTAGTIDVTVINPTGTSTTSSSDQFTYSSFSISGIQFIRTSAAGTYTCTASPLSSVSCVAATTGMTNLTGYIQFFSGSGSYTYPMTAVNNTSGSTITITNGSVTNGGTPNPANFSITNGTSNSNSLTLAHGGPGSTIWTFTVVVNGTTYTLTVNVS